MPANGIETLALLKELRELTADVDGAQRLAWTDPWLRARSWFESKLEGWPVEHHYDAAGNHWITLEGRSKKSLLLGGHLEVLDLRLDELADFGRIDLHVLLLVPSA